MAVVGGTDEMDSKTRRDSKTMSVCVTSDRTADRRSKGVINLLFKSKVRTTLIQSHREKNRLTFKNRYYI